MRRSTGILGLFSLLRAGSAGAAFLATILSCSDSTSPSNKAASDGVVSVEIVVPDSIKVAHAAQFSGTLLTAPAGVSADVLLSPTSTLSTVVGAAYVESKVPFAPESAPSLTPDTVYDDGYLQDVPLGFSFSFYGSAYSKVNVYSNGFVMFGPAVFDRYGFYYGSLIPSSANPNNIIALAWTDWAPQAVPGGIRYETRGTAPNRRFILQFTNVPEYNSRGNYSGNGRLTSQLVLSEGSNDITIYTDTMRITNSSNRVTQGIENADGTEAAYDSLQNLVTGAWSPRVNGFFNLPSKEGIRFSPPRVNQPPVITAPPNISATTTPPSLAGDTRIALALNVGVGACAAFVDPGVATATDDAVGVTLAGARNDGLALDAAYPKGATTITWTATDADGLSATATQTITVNDKEKPSVTAPANISVRTDHNASTATVVVVEATAVDNCHDVTVSGARSDNLPLLTGYPIGVTTITWNAIDASGNVGSAVQTITVIGNTAPVITAPANISVNTDPGVCSAVVNPGTATATDDAEGTTVVGVRNDGGALNGAYSKGITTITWTATDAEKLTASAIQTVTVTDKQKPSVTPPSSISTGNNPGLASAAVSVGTAAAEDNCHEVNVSGVRSDGGALGSLYPVGVTTITWTATDASGNSASATQTITVVDVEAPSISVPADFAVNATSASGAVVTFAVNAADNVGVTSVSCDHNSGSVFPIGYTSVTCVASDAAGHRTSATFGVDVVGAEQQMVNLVQYVLSLGLPDGTTNPLVNQLRAASGDGSDPQACKKINDFISMVVKKGRDIPPRDLAYMITQARRIENVMGCSL